MKKSLIIFSLLFTVFSFGAFAQKSNVNSTWKHLRYYEVEQAQRAIDAASKHEQTINDPKTWFYRGQVYYVIDTSSEFQHLSKKPLVVSLKSFAKAMELDEKERYLPEIKPFLINISSSSYNEAVSSYNQALVTKDTAIFRDALRSFGNFFVSLQMLGKDAGIVVSNLQKYGISINDILLYAGYSARMIGKDEEATQLFQQLVNNGVEDPTAYINLAELQMEKGDTAAAITTLENGKKAIPGNKALVQKELIIYQQQGREDELVEKLEKAIEEDPDNINFYLVLASHYDEFSEKSAKGGDKKKAEEWKQKSLEVYKRALERDPESFDANFNYGILIYNQGVDIVNAAKSMKDYKAAMKEEDKAKVYFKKAQPYLEKSCDLDCSDQNLQLALRKIYIITNQSEKIGEMNKKIKEQEANKAEE